MKLVDESGKLFFIDDQISELPIFWEAEEGHELIRQVDRDGKVTKVYSDLDPLNLTYFGLKCTWGKCGFYPKTGQMLINDTCVKLGEEQATSDGSNVVVHPIEETISYRRRVIGDSDGNKQTLLSEITFGNHALMIRLIPNFEIIYTKRNKGEIAQDI